MTDVIVNTGYTKLGKYTVVPVADLSSLAASVNVVGDARKGTKGGTTSLGKHAGMVVLANMGSGVYREVIALGATPAALWQTVDGGTQYTPV